MNKITFWMRALDFFGIRKLTQGQKCSIDKHVWSDEKHWISETWFEDYPFGDEAIYKECTACGKEEIIRTIY